MDITAIPGKVEAAIDRIKENPPVKGYPTPEGLSDARPQARETLRPDRLRKGRIDEALLLHMLQTYRLLRLGMGWLAIAYPIVLVVLGYLVFNLAWQPSISDYYYALPRGLTSADPAADMSFPVRAFFCGGLIAIGFFLILYKGISWLEDWALNLAGAFAIGVAIFPMKKLPFVTIWPTWLHFACAILLFVCMWFISRYCAKDTLRFFPEGSPDVPRYEAIYKRLSRLMLAVLVAGGIYFFTKGTLDAVFPSTLFFIEAAGVAVFGSYWVIKSWEISKHEFGRARQ
jgi:hypothetical protein